MYFVSEHLLFMFFVFEHLLFMFFSQMWCHVVQYAGTSILEELVVPTTKGMGNMFFKNVDTHQPKYKVSYPGRPYLTLTATRTINHTFHKHTPEAW